MKEFGRLYYTDTVYINFDSNSRMAELFASDLDTDRLIMGLELYSGRKLILTTHLLIFDEVQEVPRALSSLKYFYENAPIPHCMRRISAWALPCTKALLSRWARWTFEAIPVFLSRSF